MRNVSQASLSPSAPSSYHAPDEPRTALRLDRSYVLYRMGDVPRSWLDTLHKLSMGPVEGAMVRWTYHDGSTWAMIAFEGQRRAASNIMGWAVFTLQEAPDPIVGVYVDPQHRRKGIGTQLVTRLLEQCRDRVPFGVIYAVAEWWPKYSELIEAAGFDLIEWD